MRARELRAFDVRAVFEKLLTKNDKGANAHQLLGPESAPSCDLGVFLARQEIAMGRASLVLLCSSLGNPDSGERGRKRPASKLTCP